jgi:16S rRNA (cytidine1402-2'-O)-methyltransferase
MTSMPGTLYIVSTPIGNLEDVTLRALRVLKEVDVIAAEDTRHSLKFLNHYGIKKQLISYWGEKEKVRAEETVRMLKEGRSVALISDAGTPGISDPGAVLIRKAIEEGIRVVPVPGPSAVITALSLSGFPTDEFTFCGFLPPKAVQRRKELERLSLEQRPLVFYEAPHRILDTIDDIREIMGERDIVVIKELTKFYEEVYRGNVSGVLQRLQEATIAGEFVVVLSGRQEQGEANIGDALREIKDLMRKGLGRKESVKKVAEAYGFGRKELYDRSLEGE